MSSRCMNVKLMLTLCNLRGKCYNTENGACVWTGYGLEIYFSHFNWSAWMHNCRNTDVKDTIKVCC